MNARILFILTGVSGMIGMLSLIALSLLTYWIDLNPVEKLSDEGVAELQFILAGEVIARSVSEIALLSFALLLVLFLLARIEERN